MATAYIPLPSYTRHLNSDAPITVFSSPDHAIAAAPFRVRYMMTVRLLTLPEYFDSGISATHLGALKSSRGRTVVYPRDFCVVRVEPVK